MNVFKVRVKDIFMQDWHSRLDNSSRARFYVSISNFEYKKYLDILNVERCRKSLCKLRVSLHRLEIETGRWTKPNKTPVDARECKMCNVLEDEYHFILECVLYSDIRKAYINKYYWTRPNMLKLIELFTNENTKCLKKLGIFVDKTFELRKDLGLV